MSDKRHYKIGERLYSRWYLEQSSGQRILALAYCDKLPVICTCNNVPMHIAQGRTYYLKRNPGTGPLHRSDCSLFSQDDIEQQHAIPVVTQKNSLVRDGKQIKVLMGFNSPYLPGKLSVAKDVEHGLSLEHLLGLIWREAAFNLFPQRRSAAVGWFMDLVMSVAARIELCGAGLLKEYLLIPHEFDANFQNHMKGRERWLKLFDAETHGHFMAMGFVKSHSLTQKKNTLVHLKNMPEFPFILDGQYDSALGMAAMDGLCDIVMLCVAKKSGAYIVVEDVALLSVMHKGLLPIAHHLDYQLAERLIGEKRRFIKPISTNGSIMDGAFLTDCKDGCRIVFTQTQQSNSIMVGNSVNQVELPERLKKPQE